MSATAADVATGPRVREIRALTSSAFVLRFDRRGMDFVPGQYVAVGRHGEIDMREYSIYSSPSDEFLEILVKEVPEGLVSPRLRQLTPGDRLAVDGPYGFFTIDEESRAGRPILFIATGTGISPFHCFAQSYPDLDYRLLHGIRTLEERYEHGVFDGNRVVSCVSRGAHPPLPPEDVAVSGRNTVFPGRVTSYLRANPVAPDTLCFLCGNCDMIYESFDILKTQGVAPEQLYAEVYF